VTCILSLVLLVSPVSNVFLCNSSTQFSAVLLLFDFTVLHRPVHINLHYAYGTVQTVTI